MIRLVQTLQISLMHLGKHCLPSPWFSFWKKLQFKDRERQKIDVDYSFIQFKAPIQFLIEGTLIMAAAVDYTNTRNQSQLVLQVTVQLAVVLPPAATAPERHLRWSPANKFNLYFNFQNNTLLSFSSPWISKSSRYPPLSHHERDTLLFTSMFFCIRHNVRIIYALFFFKKKSYIIKLIFYILIKFARRVVSWVVFNQNGSNPLL